MCARRAHGIEVNRRQRAQADEEGSGAQHLCEREFVSSAGWGGFPSMSSGDVGLPTYRRVTSQASLKSAA
eukprot:5049961-Prymnesium_polylepis.1